MKYRVSVDITRAAFVYVDAKDADEAENKAINLQFDETDVEYGGPREVSVQWADVVNDPE